MRHKKEDQSGMKKARICKGEGIFSFLLPYYITCAGDFKEGFFKVFAFELGSDFVWPAARRNFSLMKDVNLVAKRIDFLHEMSRKQNRVVGFERLYERAHVNYLGRVKTRGWLVQNQNAWVIDKCLCEIDTLTLAFGESFYLFGEKLCKGEIFN